MSGSDVQAHILEPMQRLFQPTRKLSPEDEKFTLLEYVEALKRFNAETLQDAWKTVRDTHSRTSWPAPAVFVQAASKAAKEANDGGRAGGKPVSQDNERWERWRSICCQPIAYEAVKREVAWALRCAILNDGKEAHQISLQELTSARNSAERLAQGLMSGKPFEHRGKRLDFKPEQRELALKMWRTIQTRESETHDEIRRLSA